MNNRARQFLAQSHFYFARSITLMGERIEVSFFLSRQK